MEYLDQIKYFFNMCRIAFPIIIMILGPISWIHFWLYHKSPKYYLFVIRLFSRWKDTNWKISAIYKIQRDKNVFLAFEKVLTGIYGDNSYRKRVNLANKKMYEFDVFSLIVQFNLDESEADEVSVEFHFNNINVTYKNSQTRLDDLQRIFHRLEEKVIFIDKTYDLKIKFEDKFNNPFYGIAIKHLGEEHILDFECTFPISVMGIRFNQESMASDNIIRVFKDSIDINNNEFDVVKSCAKKCLLLE